MIYSVGESGQKNGNIKLRLFIIYWEVSEKLIFRLFLKLWLWIFLEIKV